MIVVAVCAVDAEARPPRTASSCSVRLLVPMNPTEVTKTAVLYNPKGLHLRPAGLLAQLAGQYSAEVTLTKDNLTVDARSILDLLTLVATEGSELIVSARGDDAKPAVDAIVQFIATDVTEEDNDG